MLHSELWTRIDGFRLNSAAWFLCFNWFTTKDLFKPTIKKQLSTFNEKHSLSRNWNNIKYWLYNLEKLHQWIRNESHENITWNWLQLLKLWNSSDYRRWIYCYMVEIFSLIWKIIRNVLYTFISIFLYVNFAPYMYIIWKHLIWWHKY